MPPAIRLRRSDPTGPGLRRRRRGRGFEYVDADGTRVEDSEVLQRINELVIPPAWQEVWICPYPGGHIQATGIDARGRKQYLYHPKWRQRRDQEKFDDMIRFAKSLPGMREAVERDLHSEPLSREQVLACAVRLLDKGFFRIGSEDYAVENESYGLATMHKAHVRILDDDVLLFDYPSKSSKRRVQSVVDADVAAVVRRLKSRRGGGPELLAFEQDGRWVDITYDWKIRADKPLLRRLSFLLKPVFAANHRWAMAKGEESLRLELRRRRGSDSVPPPPPATFRRP